MDGEGKFALAVKLLPQLDTDWAYAKVPPQAVIVPDVVAPTKLEGVD